MSRKENVVYCGECLNKTNKKVRLVVDTCPQCGTSWAAPDVFSIPMNEVKRDGKRKSIGSTPR